MKSCVVLSIPGSGTHLIMKLLNLLGMNEFFCYNSDKKEYDFSILPEEGDYAFAAHASPCEKHYNQIKRGIFITRDPRDIVISTYFNARKIGEYPHLNHLPKDEWLMAFIKGYPGEYQGKKGIYQGINWLFKHQINWRTRPGIYFTRYENFMEEDSMRKEIINIANHLEIQLTEEKLDYCMKNLLGSNPLYPERFRKGIVGDWKNHFKKEHRIAIDEEIDNLLIEEGYEKDHNWVNET